MGFKNNDVITHVNGILIDSLPKAFEAYRSTIRKGTIARVEVLRNGRPNILTYRLR